jgi:hypothetical protein
MALRSAAGTVYGNMHFPVVTAEQLGLATPGWLFNEASPWQRPHVLASGLQTAISLVRLKSMTKPDINSMKRSMVHFQPAAVRVFGLPVHSGGSEEFCRMNCVRGNQSGSKHMFAK